MRGSRASVLRRLTQFTLAGLLAALGVSGAVPPPAPVPAPPALDGVPPAKAVPPTPTPTAAAAVRTAFADVVPMALTDAPFVRYLWLRAPVTEEEEYKAAAWGVNLVSRASRPLFPPAVPLPGSVLLRVDLRDYWPRAGDLADVLVLWECFQFDPTFSLLITHDTVRLAGLDPKVLPKVRRKGWRVEKQRYQDEGGAWREKDVRVPTDERVGFADAPDVQAVRLDAPDLDSVAHEWATLKALTLSEAPVVEADYFLFRALSTIKDDGVYKVIFGGLYYDLRGVKKVKDVKGPEVKATDEDLYFENLGVGNIAAGETYERLLDRVRGDLRPTMFVSEVTGKPRAVVAFHTPAEREGQSWGAVTWDLKDKSVDVLNHPALTQIKPLIDAQEAIFPAANGLPVFALFNGAGALQDEAPFDVVSDRSVPAPHTTRLQAAIGCVRCHAPHAMWQPLRDDVGTLLRTGRLKVLGDLSQLDADVDDTRDRVLGLHDGDPDYLLSRARQDFNRTALKALGPWKRLAKEEGGQTKAGQAACKKLADRYDAWWYRPVTPQAALAELGVRVPEAAAARTLALLLPPAGGDSVLGVVFEDARLAALTAGVPVKRTDWSLVRSFAAGRAATAARALLAASQNGNGARGL